ncbi:hypothetical protein C1I98_25235, partial [Spongiactinospora gelatinilytica]
MLTTLTRITLAAAVAAITLFAAPGPSAADDVLSRLAADLRAAHAVADGDGVTVAILGDGIDARLPELRGRVKAAPDLYKPKESEQRFGTLLAGLIAGKGNPRGTSVRGVAPAADILSIRVMPTGERAYRRFVKSDDLDNVADAIRSAADRGADVILVTDARGEAGGNDELLSAIEHANGKNAVIVSASPRLVDDSLKKAPASQIGYPPGFPGVIGVGTLNGQGRRDPAYSARNSTIAVSAPGTKVDTTGDGGKSSWWVQGGDVAAAWVAGTAALIRQEHPKLPPDLVARAITSSTRGRPPGGYDFERGHGIINPAAALKAAGDLTDIADTADAEGKTLPESTRAGGGPPKTPIKAVVHDRTKILGHSVLAGAGLLLLLAATLT